MALRWPPAVPDATSGKPAERCRAFQLSRDIYIFCRVVAHAVFRGAPERFYLLGEPLDPPVHDAQRAQAVARLEQVLRRAAQRPARLGQPANDLVLRQAAGLIGASPADGEGDGLPEW